MDKRQEHVLVIGGSGMLKDVSLWLTHEGYRTSVISRTSKKFEDLISDNTLMNPISVDYNDTLTLKNKLKEAIDSYGNFTQIIAWIHNNQKEILNLVCQQNTFNKIQDCKVYHVLGSSENVDEIKTTFLMPKTVKYYQIQLGFKIENQSSRWLTNTEISNGVIESIKYEKNVLVGQLEPWELKP